MVSVRPVKHAFHVPNTFSSGIRMGSGDRCICPIPTDARQADRRYRAFRGRGGDVSDLRSLASSLLSH
jgi:hypothetical protein